MICRVRVECVSRRGEPQGRRERLVSYMYRRLTIFAQRYQEEQTFLVLYCTEDKQKTIRCQIYNKNKLFFAKDNSTLEDKPFVAKILRRQTIPRFIETTHPWPRQINHSLPYRYLKKKINRRQPYITIIYRIRSII